MTNLANKMDDISFARPTVFLVKEDDKNLFIFSTLQGARGFILRQIGEYKENYTTPWTVKVTSTEENCYKINASRWILGLV